MRLIDADALLEQCEEMDKIAEGISQVQLSGMAHIEQLIIEAPTIDIAEVCGECKPYTPCIYCKHDFENRFDVDTEAEMGKGQSSNS